VDDLRPATEVAAPDLLETLQAMRRELLLREEAPTGDWVERTADDLHAGRQSGWAYPGGTAGGLALYSVREADAFGHVHVGAGPEGRERARRLAERLIASLGPSVRACALGFTGLAIEDERAVLTALAERPGSTVIERKAMERALGPEDEAAIGPPPLGLTFVPIRSVTLEALAELDVRAFAGSTDALLIGSDARHYHDVIASLLAGQLGLFLDEASTALYRSEPPRILAALLTTQQSARRAVFVDFMVDPEFRRQGLGAYLLRWGLRALRALGYERVRLWVSASNSGAIRLYDAQGFRSTATALIYRAEFGAGVPQPQTAR
jgi:ribosomal protein S18 acetylase RimI-like enzyme